MLLLLVVPEVFVIWISPRIQNPVASISECILIEEVRNKCSGFVYFFCLSFVVSVSLHGFNGRARIFCQWPWWNRTANVENIQLHELGIAPCHERICGSCKRQFTGILGALAEAMFGVECNSKVPVLCQHGETTKNRRPFEICEFIKFISTLNRFPFIELEEEIFVCIALCKHW